VVHAYFLVTNMIVMMGLAVGIDYSLFMLSRYREERARGLSSSDALAASGRTAGRAIVFSGATVVLALLGLLIIPTNIFRSLAAGAILAVAVSMLASFTLLPALIALLGDRLDAGRIPWPRFATAGASWAGAGRVVTRWPVASVLVCVACCWRALAVPGLAMRTGFSGIESLPERTGARQGFQLLEREFRSGAISEAIVVIDGAANAAPITAAIARLRVALAADRAFVPDKARLQVNAAGTLAVLTVPMTGDAESEATQAGVRRLRGEHIARVFEGVAAQVFVAGNAAGYIDFFRLTDRYTPIVFAFVLSLSFVLLTVAFRSLVVPLKAILLNLLSVAAAYGLMVLVFQHGVGATLFGFQRVALIEAWIPLFLFTILYGLSMDYHVFLLSRIRERFEATGSNDEAVAAGMRSTTGVITGAALIMVAIFAGFASGELVMFQQVGFGLAVAVLLDATLVRSVLVPAAMILLGDKNWYLPGWLAWLPRW
jgi:RND superfamily putative drug exporter